MDREGRRLRITIWVVAGLFLTAAAVFLVAKTLGRVRPASDISRNPASANQVNIRTDEDSSEPFGEEFSDKSLFLSAIKQGPAASSTPATGLTVSHHLLAVKMIAAAYAALGNNHYRQVIILTPDHYSAGKTDISVSARPFETVFGRLEADPDLAAALEDDPGVSAGDFFYREHGAGVQLPFIRYYFPEAKVTAVSFKPGTPEAELDAVVETLKTSLEASSTLVIQSTDFSHYLTPEEAEVKDKESLAVLAGTSSAAVLGLKQPDNVDSIAAFYVQSRLQAELFRAAPRVLAHKNSQDYTEDKVTSSTSYISALYAPAAVKEGQAEKKSGSAELLFVGDIMLSRYIGEETAAKGYDFPYALIKDRLQAPDLAIGNLEGPIATGGVDAGHLFSFRADPRNAPALKEAGFDVLTVANNHIFDYGRTALSETLADLEKAGLAYAGAGHNQAEARAGVIKEVNGVRIGFLAYTDLLPASTLAAASQAGLASADPAALATDIKALKAKADLVVVSFHFGKEYQDRSNAHQQALALAAVKAGADLVIGHHPHVPQEVSYIEGVPVAYSLGNFIFDQNFSTSTASGLMLAVTVKDKKITAVDPLPVRFNRSFQPYQP